MLSLRSAKPLLIALTVMFAQQTVSFAQKTKVDNEVKQTDSQAQKQPEIKVKDQDTKAYDAQQKSKDAAGKKEENKSTEATKPAKGEMTAKQAEDLVRSRKEVKEWLTLFTKAKKQHRKVGTPEIEAERDGANWLVHVYESLPDHTATFNWYTIDPKTSKTTTMF